MAEFATKSGRAMATLNNRWPWPREDFAHLGTVTFADGAVIGWAWHADGRSIDRDDRGFDLVGFPPSSDLLETRTHYFWLGADG